MAIVKGIEVGGETYDIADETARADAQTASSAVTEITPQVEENTEKVEQATSAVEGLQVAMEALDEQIGDLSELETTAKTSLVAAINEVNANAGLQYFAEDFSAAGSNGTVHLLKSGRTLIPYFEMDDNTFRSGDYVVTVQGLADFLSEYQPVSINFRIYPGLPDSYPDGFRLCGNGWLRTDGTLHFSINKNFTDDSNLFSGFQFTRGTLR